MRKLLQKSNTEPVMHSSHSSSSASSEKTTSIILTDDKREETLISVNRSDGLVHDLQNVLSGLSSSAISQKVTSPASRLSSKSGEAEPTEHETINVVRSDGLSHDIIQVFKAESDARGDTLRIKSRQPSVVKISLDSPPADAMKSRSRQPSVAKIDAATIQQALYFPKNVRIVHMSDTHDFLNPNRPTKNQDFLPDGDILVHSGNFSNGGTDEEYALFNQWLGQTATGKYHYRVVCPGSRDVRALGTDWDAVRRRLPNATHVLCHNEATILGIRFYGCPWHWGHRSNYTGPFPLMVYNTSLTLKLTLCIVVSAARCAERDIRTLR